MQIQALKSKIHRATVVQAELNYIGSITIDEELLEQSGILEYEKVQIVDIDNGERFETYAICGERKSGMICLNGAAARKVSVGDKVLVTTGEEEKEYIVSALYQSMNNMGEVIRFSEKAKVSYDSSYGSLGMEITMAEPMSKDEKEQVRKKIEKLYPDAKVSTMGEFIEEMLGGTVSQVGELKGLLFFLVIVINVLVVVLMQKMFLLREKREIATMKAIGFSDNALIVWQMKRIGMVVFAGILVGVLTGEWFTQITCGQVFKMMGARIDFTLDILQGYILYPIVMFVVILLACTLVTQKIRKIDVKTMNKE